MKLKFLLFIYLMAAACLLFGQHHSSRDKWQQPERIMDSLQIKEGMIIGEAGAGDGYFTFFLARRVGERGHIYANDISKRVLGKLRDRAEEENVKNISTVLGDEKDPLFPADTLDMVVMMRAFHDFEYPEEWMKNVQSYLRQGAPVVIIDPDPDKSGHGRGHFKTCREIISIMNETDFQLMEIKEFLERDNIYIYRLKID